ncbi:hypothetical protein ASG76_14675 [Nocardioides sp. Soil774]|nr:hypothetical protein ASG76_14675 [Nocardioides sp. Soil774]
MALDVEEPLPQVGEGDADARVVALPDPGGGRHDADDGLCRGGGVLRGGLRPPAEQLVQHLVAGVVQPRQRPGEAAGAGELAEEFGMVAGGERVKGPLGSGLVLVAPVDPVLLAALFDPHDGFSGRLVVLTGFTVRRV